MDKLPKLLPFWHDVSLKDGHFRDIKFSNSTYPDHGGVGFDVSIKNGILEYELLKSAKNLVNFASNSCALPFMSPNKVKSLFDPCLKKLNERKQKLEDFSLKLDSAVTHMKSHRHFRKAIVNAYDDILNQTENEDVMIPSTVINAAKLFPMDYPLPTTQWNYTGGCITKVALEPGFEYLLHPVGKKLNKLALTPLEELQEESKVMLASENNQRIIKCENSPIFQIATALNSCCVRQKNNIHYINLKFLNYPDDIYNMETFAFENVSFVSMSNFVPGEILIATEDGHLFLQNMDLKKTIWQTDELLLHDLSVHDKFWGCSFGSHPRSLLYFDRLTYLALDIRLKGVQAVNLFSIPNPFSMDSENIMVIKKLENNDFQHLVATDLHLFVIDERYPQQPIMSWNHMLESPPLYCDIQPYEKSNNSTNYIAVLGTQEFQDVSTFHLESQPTRIQPLSLSFPLHLSKPKDIIDSLKLSCQSVDFQLEQRLSMPLIGVAILPHSKNVGYTVLQLTSLGDVFYQDFKVDPDNIEDKSNRIGPACVLKPPDEIMSRVQDWFKLAIIKNEKCFPNKLNNKLSLTSSKRGIFKMKSSSPTCPVCNQKPAFESDNDDFVNMCPKCNLNISDSKDMLTSAKNLDMLVGSQLEEHTFKEQLSSSLPELINVDEISDPISKRFLSPWMEKNLASVTDLTYFQQNTTSYSSQITSTQPSQTIIPSETIITQSDQLPSTSNIDSNIQDFSESEDIIPPTQDVGFGLYKARKKHKPDKSQSKFISGF